MKDNSPALIGLVVVMVLVTAGWQLQQRRADAARQLAMVAAQNERQAAEAAREQVEKAEALKRAEKEAEMLRPRFAKIKEDMSVKEVEAIMGSPGKEPGWDGEPLPLPELQTKFLEWGTRPFKFRCAFKNGKATENRVELKPDAKP